MAKTAKPAKKPKSEKDDRPQAERFIEAARQIGADETGEQFERAFEKLVPASRPKRLSD